MVKRAIFLRGAAALSVLLALDHTAGGLDHMSPPDDAEVLRSMGTFRFDALGSNRSDLEFYLGFGFIISLYPFAQSLLLWQLASRASSPDARVRPWLATRLAGVETDRQLEGSSRRSGETRSRR